MNKKTIYIVLSQTSTYFARLIRMYTREPYAHVSIALHPELDEMYSFGRRNPDNPFSAGFVGESIARGTYAKFPGTICGIYSIDVTEAQYYKLKNQIKKFKKNKEKYSYNLIGVLGLMFNFPVANKYKYFCSQFVAYILEKSDIKLFDKSYCLVKPVDFRTCKALNSIYEGKMIEYDFHTCIPLRMSNLR